MVFAGLVGLSLTPVTSAHTQSSLPGSAASTARCVIALDPGHNPVDTTEYDPVTGAFMYDYPNGAEDADALEIARAVESRLNLVGIGTEMVKTSVDEDVTYRERVDRASAAGAFMGASIHTTPGEVNSAVHPQHQGGYRTGTDADGNPATVTFDNPGLAAESGHYSGVVATTRSVIERQNVPVRDISFDGREPLWAGDIPVISLIADTPWIYNEFGSATGGGAHGLDNAEKARYINGLSAGLIAVAATAPACTGIGS